MPETVSHGPRYVDHWPSPAHGRHPARRPSLAGGLFTTARERARQVQRNQRPRQRYEQDLQPVTPTGPVREEVQRERLTVLDKELNRLPERYR